MATKINIKEIYSQKVFDYLKPSFPTLTDEQLWYKVSLYHVLTEEFKVILETIQEITNMAIDETTKNGMAYYNSTNYVVKKQLEAEMLKTKEQVIVGNDRFIRCFDKFGEEILEGDVLQVQGIKDVLVDGNDLNGQLCFSPYGKVERVSSYFSNDLIKSM
jgi:hypothetical protein